MARTIRFSHTLRGLECDVEASEFDYDPTVGINLGPNQITATTSERVEIELTDKELEELSGIATDCYLSDDGF
jgi:hypothetical protein